MRDGEIDALADFPRKHYNEIRNLEEKPIFIRAEFKLSEALAEEVAELTGVAAEHVEIADVSRDLNGNHFVGFPNAFPIRALPADDVVTTLKDGAGDIGNMEPSKSEESLKEQMLAALAEARSVAEASGESAGGNALRKIKGLLKAVDPEKATKRSTIGPRYSSVLDSVEEMVAEVSKPAPANVPEARKAVFRALPSFVYYANYGNLDSEIYLPHVIQNMGRSDLGGREEAKTRTLRVLFEFVRLMPEEILGLGRDFPVATSGEPSQEQIQDVANKKREREILLQSASANLTQKFRDWWKQGEYRLRFQADGSHFRIWVSDDQRPEEIELEGRSTGLQWFLSFYLVF